MKPPKPRPRKCTPKPYTPPHTFGKLVIPPHTRIRDGGVVKHDEAGYVEPSDRRT